MNQQFYQHQPVVTVAIPAPDQNVRIWLRSSGENIQPQIVEGKVHSVSVFDEGDLQSILLWTNAGLESIHWTIIGSIEIV